MQYRPLGRTGVQVSTLALGTMNLGRIGGTTQADADALVGAALDAGTAAATRRVGGLPHGRMP